jgi:hypothetical protein
MAVMKEVDREAVADHSALHMATTTTMDTADLATADAHPDHITIPSQVPSRIPDTTLAKPARHSL